MSHTLQSWEMPSYSRLIGAEFAKGDPGSPTDCLTNAEPSESCCRQKKKELNDLHGTNQPEIFLFRRKTTKVNCQSRVPLVFKIKHTRRPKSANPFLHPPDSRHRPSEICFALTYMSRGHSVPMAPFVRSPNTILITWTLK